MNAYIRLCESLTWWEMCCAHYAIEQQYKYQTSAIEQSFKLDASTQTSITGMPYTQNTTKYYNRLLLSENNAIAQKEMLEWSLSYI